MTTAKYLGIWMDHSRANLMEFSTGEIETKTIDAGFTLEPPKSSPEKSEHSVHMKEQHLQAGYYHHLGEVIRNYERVILFGPTSAKSELLNKLKADHRFENIKIEAQQADKMTENQQHAFVKKYFSKYL